MLFGILHKYLTAEEDTDELSHRKF